MYRTRAWLAVGLLVAVLSAYAIAQYSPSRGSGPTSGTVELGFESREFRIAPGQEVGLVAGTTLELGATTLNTINTPICDSRFHRRFQVTTGGPFLIPPDGGLLDRSSITIRNVSSSAIATCTAEPIDAGFPLNCVTDGLGNMVFAQGGQFTYDVRDSVPVYCRGCSGNTLLEFYEVALCAAP